MKDKLTFEAFYPHTPAKVWKALTENAALSDWLMPTNFEPRIGFRFEFKASERSVHGEVIEAKSPEVLAYTWDDGEAGSPSIVTWRLEPKDGGTLLRLEHEASVETPTYVLIEANANWVQAHARLRGYLRQPVPIVFAVDEPEKVSGRRAGFRQPEVMV